MTEVVDVQGFGLRVSGSESRGQELRVSGFGFRVYGFGLSVLMTSPVICFGP